MKKITSKNAKYIIKIAKKMGAKVKILSYERNTFEIIYKNRSFILTEKIRITRNSIGNSALTIHKDLTHKLLRKYHLSTPKTFLIGKNDDPEKLLNRLTPPYVVKESSASASINVFTDIARKKEAIKIIKSLLKKVNFIVAQSMAYGKEYRVTILGDKVIGVLQLIPPYIVGNGKNKIKDLIAKKSKKTPQPIKVDFDLIKTIKKEGFSLKDVLPKNKKVCLRTHSLLAEGGEMRDKTDDIHPKIKNICIKASKIVNLNLAGFDILCNNISKDPDKQNFTILEINGRPDLYIHYIPNYGKSRDVIKKILNFIVKL